MNLLVFFQNVGENQGPVFPLRESPPLPPLQGLLSLELEAGPSLLDREGRTQTAEKLVWAWSGSQGYGASRGSR